MVHIFGSQWRSCLTSTSIAPTMKHSAWPLCRRYLGGSGTVVMYDFCSSCFVHAVNLYFYMYINCSLQPICLFLHNLDIYPSLITCSRHSFAVDSIWHFCKADRNTSKSPEATFPQQRQGPAKLLLQKLLESIWVLLTRKCSHLCYTYSYVLTLFSLPFFSCVGIWQNDRVEIITNDQANHTTPSYLSFFDNECLIGDSAKNQVAMNSHNTWVIRTLVLLRTISKWHPFFWPVFSTRRVSLATSSLTLRCNSLQGLQQAGL